MIEQAEGCELIDADGRRYLDGVSSLWCNVHGHRHPLIDAAVRDQLDRVAHSTMLGLSHPGAAELAARLVEIAPPGLSRVFFSDSGSTAAEVALKMAFQYWQQQGGQHVRRRSFICLQDAYHGDTIGSVSVGGMDLFHSSFAPAALPRPTARRAGDIADMERAARPPRGGAGRRDRRAAGPGRGRHGHAPARLPAGVRELCDRHGVLLICDEVATGFGRTGTMFACEQEGVAPGPALPRQGPDRRLHAARRDAGDRARSTRPSSAPTRSSRPSSTATPTRATRSPARPRSAASTSFELERTLLAPAEDQAARPSCSTTSRRWPRSPRSASAASWSASTWASTTLR